MADRVKMCFGFIRTNTQNMDIFPSSLLWVVVGYAVGFEWDTVNCRKDIEISEDKQTATPTITSNQVAVCAFPLSSDLMSRVEWELTITTEVTEGIIFQMGFVEYPLDESLPNDDSSSFISGNERCSIYIDRTETYFRVYHFATSFQDSKTVSNFNCSDVGKGDRMKLIFDFEEKKCDFHYNDAYCATITESNHLPDRLIPAIAVYVEQHSYECTQWLVDWRRSNVSM